jgi:hypothetical protein
LTTEHHDARSSIVVISISSGSARWHNRQREPRDAPLKIERKGRAFDAEWPHIEPGVVHELRIVDESPAAIQAEVRFSSRLCFNEDVNPRRAPLISQQQLRHLINTKACDLTSSILWVRSLCRCRVTIVRLIQKHTISRLVRQLIVDTLPSEPDRRRSCLYQEVDEFIARHAWNCG